MSERSASVIGQVREARSRAGAADRPVPTETKALRGRLDGLQLGRAVAAIAVVIGHAVDHAFHHTIGPDWQLGGRYGVTLFFVISGFIMTETTGIGRFDAIGFISRRIRRVVPLYWLVTLLVAVTAAIAPTLFQRTSFHWSYLIPSLLFVPVYDPTGIGGICPMFKLGWTLNFEMFFYVVFAGTFFLRSVERAIVLTLLFGACIVIGQVTSFTAAIPAFYTRIDTLGFVAGVWLAILHQRSLLSATWRTIIPLFLASFAVGAAIVFQYARIEAAPMTQIALVAVCFAHVALMLMIVDGLGWRLPRPLLFVGDASYSVYLFHMFAVGVMTVAVRHVPPRFAWPMVALSAVVALAFGLVAYRVIERPLNRLMRHRRPLTAAQLGGRALAQF